VLIEIRMKSQPRPLAVARELLQREGEHEGRRPAADRRIGDPILEIVDFIHPALPLRMKQYGRERNAVKRGAG
jgi:hypothetical protein